MLTRNEAQPKSRRHGSGVAYAVALAIALLAGSPAPPEGAAAATGQSTAGQPSAGRTSAGQGAWPWPLLGEVITHYRNGSDPYAAGQHRGIDIAAPTGTSVRAIVDGRVSFSGRLPDGGETVTVRSSDGAHLVSSLHLSVRSVRRGATVAAGESLGKVGESGKRSATRPHLHLSVRSAATRAYVDPMTLLGAQRVAEAPAIRQEPLEQPQSQSHARAREHAAARGGTASDTPAAVVTTQPARIAAAKREGRARSGATESRAAPPPLASPTEPKANPTANPTANPQSISQPAPSPTAAPVAEPSSAPISRPLLLVVAVICAAALLLRRSSSRTVPEHEPAPASAAAAEPETHAEVIPLHRAS